MQKGLYNIDQFQDSCGFGLLAKYRGAASHQLVKKAINALTCMTHRGGVAADGKTGDGCGILLQMPEQFMRSEAKKTRFPIG